MKTYPISGTAELSIEVPFGGVRVRASDRDDVAVEVEPAKPDRPNNVAAARKTTVDASGERITILGPKKWSFIGPGKDDSIEVIVDVPVGTRVDARVDLGWFRGEGSLGDVRLRGGSTEFTLDECDQLEARGGHGSVRIGHVRGDADITLASGSCRVGRVDGDVRVKGAHGNVELGEVAGELHATTATGSIEVDRAEGDIDLRTAHGALRVGELVRGTAHIESAHGVIEVGIRPGTAVWLDASTDHGAVRSSLGEDTGPAGDDETLQLRARSNYGDIMIRYATS